MLNFLKLVSNIPLRRFSASQHWLHQTSFARQNPMFPQTFIPWDSSFSSSIPEIIYIYTDGSFRNNKSGYGIYMGEEHPLNLSEPIVNGRHTCTRAEILAVIKALQNVKTWDNYNDEPVVVRTDLKQIVLFFNGKLGSNPVYGKEFVELSEARSQFKSNSVKIEYVKGHSGDLGNKMADELSLKATEERG